MSGRIRSIKPEILEDEPTAALSDAAWRLWVSMWTLADDYGNLRGDSRRLSAAVWWAHDKPPKIAELLTELINGEFVQPYTVRGQVYYHICNWDKHQRIDNAGKPRVPGASDADQTSAETRGEIPQAAENRRSDLDPDLDLERDKEPAPPRFDFHPLYARYPRKEGKRKGMEKLKAAIKTPEQFERFTQALDNYAAKVKAEAMEARFVLHWSTFCAGRWEDYAEGPQLALGGMKEAPKVWRGQQVGIAPVGTFGDKVRDAAGDV